MHALSDADKVKSAIDLVEKVTKQIITLSSGIIVILVTVMGYYFEYLNYQPNQWIWVTLVAGIFLIFSIVLGIFVYGALISSIHKSEKLQDANVYSETITAFAILQWHACMQLFTVDFFCVCVKI
jgi:hypothetical protein